MESENVLFVLTNISSISNQVNCYSADSLLGSQFGVEDPRHAFAYVRCRLKRSSAHPLCRLFLDIGLFSSSSISGSSSLASSSYPEASFEHLKHHLSTIL